MNVRACGGHNSARKIEMPRPNGNAISTATSDVASVPTIKGIAPNTSPTGFHVVRVMNDQPACARVGSERSHSITPTPTIRASNVTDESAMTALNGKVNEQTYDIDAFGNVLVVSDDSTRLRSERLFWDNKRRLIHTPDYVSIVSPKEKVQGQGFESDQRLRNYRIFKVTAQVRAE